MKIILNESTLYNVYPHELKIITRLSSSDGTRNGDGFIAKRKNPSSEEIIATLGPGQLPKFTFRELYQVGEFSVVQQRVTGIPWVKGRNPLRDRCFLHGSNEDSMFSLKGRFSHDIPSATETRRVRGNFSLGPSPNVASGRRRPLHKITLLLVRPLRWPLLSLFRDHFLPRHMSTRVSPSEEFTARTEHAFSFTDSSRPGNSHRIWNYPLILLTE